MNKHSLSLNMFGTPPSPYGYGNYAQTNDFYGTPVPLVERRVGYTTNSKDPVLMRARVFVGNIDTKFWSREQIITLFSAYGTILGVTVFKGYAFIQYDNPKAADLSIQMLHGKPCNGSLLDVKLAVKDLASSESATSDTNANAGNKRKGADVLIEETNAKKGRAEGDGPSVLQAERNKLFAGSDRTTDADLYRSNVLDTMTCGKCHFMTHSFEGFRDHIKADCYARDVAVSSYGCALCAAAFIYPIDLLRHAQDVHNITIFKEIKEDIA